VRSSHFTLVSKARRARRVHVTTVLVHSGMFWILLSTAIGRLPEPGSSDVAGADLAVAHVASRVRA
jgi:hypothetical protein